MEKLRISKGIELEVNDAGDTICIPVDDMNFVNNYNRLIEMFENIDKQLKDKEKTMTPKEELQFIIAKTKEIMNEINSLFADEQCCEKVFGDIVPSPYLMASFFEQLCPFVEKHVTERQKSIMKKYKKPVRAGGK